MPAACRSTPDDDDTIVPAHCNTQRCAFCPWPALRGSLESACSARSFPDMALSFGTRLGPYEILAPLGVGGMGEVYRAKDTRLKRQVALKVLPDALTADADRLARFQREIGTSSRQTSRSVQTAPSRCSISASRKP